MFLLEKVRVMAGMNSMVFTGEMFCGRELSLWDSDKEEHPNRIRSLMDVKEGFQVILNDGTYIRTSHIAKIIDNGVDWVLFQTQTSIYRLREIEALPPVPERGGQVDVTA